MSEDKGKNLPPLDWIKALPTKAQDLIKAMASVRRIQDTLDESLKAVNKQYDYLRFVAVPAALENEGIENIRLEGIGLCYLSPEFRCRVVAERKQEAYQWLRDNSAENLITETVNAQSLSAAMKARVNNNEGPPPELFHMEALTKAVITKG